MDNIEIESVTNEINIINSTNDISIENIENEINVIQAENNIEIETPENNLELVFNQSGANGKDGIDGANGKDGLTTSVNNIEQVNGNVSLTTDDIPDTTTNRYTNDTDITRLANTSGTNTGDQPKIISQTKLNNYTQTSTLDNGKVYTYIRDEDNIVIDTIITEV